MPRFFIEADLAVDHTLELTEPVFHHWIKVLRAQIGEKATLFNGQGGEYEVELVDIAKKSAMVQVNHFNPTNRTPKFKALLGQVMSKGERMDYAIQKAVELGVSHIQLL
ncbi:RsmE family RNA methyltransferase, partial [Escherichia coli]|uniref:RsmE family RNA methyltransferase n=2 Tax=Gammaproteobacteria TaxID=1236 RepID=UPI0011F13C31